MSLDVQLLLWLNGLVGKVPIIDRLMSGAVNDYFVPVSLSLALLGLWFSGNGAAERERNQRAVIYAVIGLVIANLVVFLFNLGYFRPRPFAEYPVHLLFYMPTDSSFPSNPAAVGFAMAAGVWLGNRRLGGLLFGLASLWAFARVYAGVCYPLDVVGGGFIGVLSSYIASRGLRLAEPLPTLLLKLGRRLYLA